MNQRYTEKTVPDCSPLLTIDGELTAMRNAIISLGEAVEILEQRATTNRILSDISDNDVEPETVAVELSAQNQRVQSLTTRLLRIGEMVSRQLNGRKLE